MKKIFLSAGFILAFGAYAVYTSLTGQPQALPSSTNGTPENTGNNAGNSSANETTNPSSINNQATGQPANTNAYTYNDGDFTGNSVDAYYGNVQVKVSITNHLISDVQFLQYPNDRGTSIQVSNMSMPILKSEAIKAQSANVNIVSGATQTSQGFIESLKSALVLAQN